MLIVPHFEFEFVLQISILIVSLTLIARSLAVFHGGVGTETLLEYRECSFSMWTADFEEISCRASFSVTNTMCFQ